MKRFHLFSYESHRAIGGIDDYVASFETLEDAKAAFSGREQGEVLTTTPEGDLVLVAYWGGEEKGWVDTQNGWAG